MKNPFIISLLAVAFMFTACVESEVATDDYTFVSTLTVSCSPSLSGYPQTTTATTEKKGITEQQAKDICTEMTYTTVAKSGAYTVTQKMKTTYVLTSKYVPATGARIVY